MEKVDQADSDPFIIGPNTFDTFDGSLVPSTRSRYAAHKKPLVKMGPAKEP